MVPLAEPEPSRLRFESPSVDQIAHTVSDFEWFLGIDKERTGRSTEALMLGAAILVAVQDLARRSGYPSVSTAAFHDDLGSPVAATNAGVRHHRLRSLARGSGLTVPICIVEK